MGDKCSGNSAFFSQIGNYQVQIWTSDNNYYVKHYPLFLNFFLATEMEDMMWAIPSAYKKRNNDLTLESGILLAEMVNK